VTLQLNIEKYLQGIFRIWYINWVKLVKQLKTMIYLQPLLSLGVALILIGSRTLI